MGRKGVSKRKPKKYKSGSKDNINHGSSKAHPGENSSPVQSLVNAKESLRGRGGSNPAAGSNKKNRIGK